MFIKLWLPSLFLWYKIPMPTSKKLKSLKPEVVLKKDQNSLSTKTQALTPTAPSSQPSTALQTYLNRISRFPLLTREEEYKWAVRYYENKDPKAAEVLIQSNLRFVISVAKRYSKFSSKIMDLIQEGNIGLLKAVQEFNPYKGVRLITYAVWWIRGYIQEYLIRNYSMVRVGTNKKQKKLFYALQKEKEKFDQFSEKSLLPIIADQTNTLPEEVQEMRQRILKKDTSLDQKLNSQTQNSFLDLQVDESSLETDEALSEQQQSHQVQTHLKKMESQLTSREKYILKYRLLNKDPHTLQKIADQFNVTREAIRQMEERLMKKIKKELKPVLKKPY